MCKTLGSLTLQIRSLTLDLRSLRIYKEALLHVSIYMDQNRFSLIVPAFNEGKTIAKVLDRIFPFLPGVHEVLVIDDGSTDYTPVVN